jgi:1-phosphofructokinase
VIVTLTPNPSVDRTLEVPAFERGAVVRATSARAHPGGKGVNVARALAANGVPTRAVLPSGGREGSALLALLADLDVEVVPVPIGGSVRENVTIVEPDGTETKLNAPGPTLSSDEIAALVEATVAASRGADWVALCGSLPPGGDERLYPNLVAALHETGVRVAVDASGSALAASLPAAPDLVKPNAEELAEAVGRPLITIGDVVEAAYELLQRGAQITLVTLGAGGAVLTLDGDVFHAVAPRAMPRSTVGAGDATLAGFLADGTVGPQALRRGVAWGTAAVKLPGTQMPGPDDVDLDEVRLIDPDTRLSIERRVVTARA